MNPYFRIPESSLVDVAPEPGEYSFYVRFSQVEVDVLGEDQRTRAFWQLEGFSKAWFDDNHPPASEPTWADQDQFISYYAEARLFLLELEVIPDHLGQFDGLRFIQEFIDGETEPAEWFRVRAGGPRDDLPIEKVVPMTVFANLFQAGTALTLGDIETVDKETSDLLDKAVSTGQIADAKPTDLKRILSGSIDWSVVYDVGQGNCIGMCESNGSVGTYFDFGGGVKQNRKTFPTALKSFCFTNRPPIILSHWDHDHWSSAYLDQRALARDWIVPRQKLTAQHVNLLSDIAAAGGKAWFLPAGFKSRWFSQFHLELCTGANRNNSGIALTISEQPSGSGQQILMPGDADYRYIPSFSGGTQYLSVVVPHHGGRLHSATLPTRPGLQASRLVYSVGRPNSYKHPHTTTRQDHDSSGWRDPNHSTTPHYTRDTCDRSTAGLGHVLLGWNVHSSLPLLPCGSGSCQLQTQQS